MQTGFVVDCGGGNRLAWLAAFEGRIAVEERCAGNAIELDKVAFEMPADDCSLDATEEVFLKHLLGLIGLADVAHVFLMQRLIVGTLDPAPCEACLDKGVAHSLVGIHHNTVGKWNARAKQNAGEALTTTIFDTIAGINHQSTVVLDFLQQ